MIVGIPRNAAGSRSRRTCRAVAWLIFAATSLAGVSRAEKASVLFVGNSYTYVNDMPGMFSAIAESLGDRAEVDMAAPGGYTFESHARDKATREKIAAREWSFVVLQEQSQRPDWPSRQLESMVIPYALQLNELIHAANATAKTVFFETWGYKAGDGSNCRNIPETCTYEGMQRRLNATYADLAQRTSGRLAPVGEAWSRVRLAHPEIELYSGDGIHPSAQGSYLAACVFYSALFRKGALGADRLGLDARQANLLQRAAQDAVFHPSAAGK